MSTDKLEMLKIEACNKLAQALQDLGFQEDIHNCDYDFDACISYQSPNTDELLLELQSDNEQHIFDTVNQLNHSDIDESFSNEFIFYNSLEGLELFYLSDYEIKDIKNIHDESGLIIEITTHNNSKILLLEY